MSAAEIPPAPAHAPDAVGGPRGSWRATYGTGNAGVLQQSRTVSPKNAAIKGHQQAPSFLSQTVGGFSLQNIFGSQFRQSENNTGVAENGSGHKALAAFCRVVKSSELILRLTCTVRFPVSQRHLHRSVV